jgi:hypothetical protein
MILKETLCAQPNEPSVHPIGGRIYLLPPDTCRLLYNGNDLDLHVADRRDLTPLVIGVMAMNLVTAKALQVSYPQGLIDPVLWRPEYVSICKNLVWASPNGIEASLQTLEPSNFIYLRVSNSPAGHPLIRVHFEQSPHSSTRPLVVTR